MPRDTRTFPLPTSLPGPWSIFSFSPLGSPAICSSEDQMNKLSVFALSVFRSSLFYLPLLSERRNSLPPRSPVPSTPRSPTSLENGFLKLRQSRARSVRAVSSPPPNPASGCPANSRFYARPKATWMGGEYHGLSGMSYDTAEKSYIYYETNNWGENVYSHGSIDGDTCTNHSEMNGKTVRGRFILKRASEDSATFSFEMGMGSDPLANVMQGKQTRQK